MSYLVDSWLGKTPLVNRVTKLSTIKFIIQTIAKASSIISGKSRNVLIISVVFVVTPCMLSSHSIIIPTNAHI